MYPVTLRLIQKFCTERVHGNFLVSCNIETNSKMFLPIKWSMEISTYPVTLILRLYQKFFTERVHGNFHVSCNIETNIIQKCFTERVHGDFHVPFNIETNSKMFLLKGSMEISMYPVIFRLTHKFRVSCNIETNLEICYCISNFGFEFVLTIS